MLRYRYKWGLFISKFPGPCLQNILGLFISAKKWLRPRYQYSVRIVPIVNQTRGSFYIIRPQYKQLVYKFVCLAFGVIIIKWGRCYVHFVLTDSLQSISLSFYKQLLCQFPFAKELQSNYTEKQSKILSFKTGALKMLVKLTPVINLPTFYDQLLSLFSFSKKLQTQTVST